MRSRGLATTPQPVADDLYRLGLAIRNGRRDKGLTLNDLAMRAQISRTTARAAENGDPSVSAGILVTLLWLVGIGPLSNVVIPHMPRWGDLENPQNINRRVRPKVNDDF